MLLKKNNKKWEFLGGKVNNIDNSYEIMKNITRTKDSNTDIRNNITCLLYTSPSPRDRG